MRKHTRSRTRRATPSAHRRRATSRWRRRGVLLLPTTRVGVLARLTAFVRRLRKCAPFAFLVTLVVGYGVERNRSLASLTRFFTTITGLPIARSAFQKKFSPRAVAFLRSVFYEALPHHAAQLGTRLAGKLARFRDVTAIDATIVRLHDLLAKRFAACRTNHTLAAAKLHTVLSLSKGAVRELLITAERVGDRAFLQAADWVAGNLLLFDLGYYSHPLFCLLQTKGALFVSRLKDSANPFIVKVRCGIRRGCKTTGKRLWDIEFATGRPVDLDVRFSADPADPIFRLVGTYHAAAGCWHLYVTNLPAADFSPDEIGLIYRLRWEVELLFKELKGTCHLDDLTSRREEVVLSLFYATLLSLLVTRVLARLIEQRDADVRLSLRIVSRYLPQHAINLGKSLLRTGRRLSFVLEEILHDIALTCRDPNPQRPSALRRATA